MIEAHKRVGTTGDKLVHSCRPTPHISIDAILYADGMHVVKGRGGEDPYIQVGVDLILVLKHPLLVRQWWGVDFCRSLGSG